MCKNQYLRKMSLRNVFCTAFLWYQISFSKFNVCFTYGFYEKYPIKTYMHTEIYNSWITSSPCGPYLPIFCVIGISIFFIIFFVFRGISDIIMPLSVSVAYILERYTRTSSTLYSFRRSFLLRCSRILL